VDALALILSDAETLRTTQRSSTAPGWRSGLRGTADAMRPMGTGLWRDLRSTGELIGDCGVTVQCVDGVGTNLSGLPFAADYWGRGYATKQRRLADWAFAESEAVYVIH